MKYDMANGKKKEVEPVEKGSDPTVLYNNYIKASKHIGVKPSKSLLRALADEGNPARGEHENTYTLNTKRQKRDYYLVACRMFRHTNHYRW